MEPECSYCNPDALAQDLEILRLHKERVPAVEIAARLNVTPDLVRYRLRRAGFEPVPAPRFLKAEERRDDVIKLHNQGLSPAEISERLDLDWSRVYRILRDAQLQPRPSHEEMENTIRSLDEIVRLGKEGVPRYEIAKRTSSSWPLVAEALEKSRVMPIVPACTEITSWATTLFPIIDEIRQARPDTEPILDKVNKLEKELTAITEAAKSVEDRLPWRGIKAGEERWCLADITYVAHTSLDAIDALTACVKALDWEKLPRRLEQAETCIKNLSGIIGGAISQAASKKK